MEKIQIKTEYIKLGQFLKYIDVAQDGIEAKIMIANNEVLVNDEVCTMRGKKLYKGDKVSFTFNDDIYVVE